MTTDTHQTRLELVENLAQKWLDKPYCYKGTQMKITFPDPEQAAWKYGEGSIEHRFEAWSLACYETSHVVCGHEYHRCTELGRRFAYQMNMEGA